MYCPDATKQLSVVVVFIQSTWLDLDAVHLQIHTLQINEWLVGFRLSKRGTVLSLSEQLWIKGTLACIIQSMVSPTE